MLRFAGVLGVTLWLLCGSSLGDPIVLGSSGWSWEDQSSGVNVTVEVVDVQPGQSLTIRIAKDFSGAYDAQEDEFPTARLAFRAGTGAVPRIIVLEESVANHTGAAWTGFGWAILYGPAYFVPSASTGWSALPAFASLQWGGVAGDQAKALWASGGPGVPHDGTFTPAANLILDSTGDFTFKQYVVPEPASVTALAGLGSSLLLRRRRR